MHGQIIMYDVDAAVMRVVHSVLMSGRCLSESQFVGLEQHLVNRAYPPPLWSGRGKRCGTGKVHLNNL